VTGRDGVIVIGMRGAKKRDQPVAAFLADNPAVAANGGAHRNQRRLEPDNRRLGSSSEIKSVDRCRSPQRTVRYFRSPAMSPRILRNIGGRSGATAPHDEQNASPAFRVD
jgi:hypothetical protein